MHAPTHTSYGQDSTPAGALHSLAGRDEQWRLFAISSHSGVAMWK